MADFVNPYSQMNPERKFTRTELIRALRLDIAAEEEAASLYEAHAEMTDDPKVKKVLLDVAKEERVHVGEFQQLVNDLSEDEEELLDKGKKEVEELSDEDNEDDTNEEPGTVQEQMALYL
jgi:rubrerythrin